MTDKKLSSVVRRVTYNPARVSESRMLIRALWPARDHQRLATTYGWMETKLYPFRREGKHIVWEPERDGGQM